MFYRKITDSTKPTKTGLAMSKEWNCFWSKQNREENKKKATLLASVVAQTYKLLKSLSVPSKLSDKVFK